MKYNRLMDWPDRFESYVGKKVAAATAAVIPGYLTTESHTEFRKLSAIGNSWTIGRFDGRFYESWPTDPALPAVNTVFVQSADGNTGADNPTTLGGGQTDKHLIFEGLSSVHADAILSGATTIAGDDRVMGIWHPKLISLRIALGLPRFPAQVVATRSGNLDIESSLLYNVPQLRIFILTDDAGAETIRPHTVSRPWIDVLSAGPESDLVAGLRVLRARHGITRVSSIGGRDVTTQLIDAGVVQDIYLTTSPLPGGEPNTPFYTGDSPLNTRLVVKKAGQGDEAGVVFEHLVLEQS